MDTFETPVTSNYEEQQQLASPTYPDTEAVNVGPDDIATINGVTTEPTPPPSTLDTSDTEPFKTIPIETVPEDLPSHLSPEPKLSYDNDVVVGQPEQAPEDDVFVYDDSVDIEAVATDEADDQLAASEAPYEVVSPTDGVAFEEDVETVVIAGEEEIEEE